MSNSNQKHTNLLHDLIGHRYVYGPTVMPSDILAQYRDQAIGYDANMRDWEFRTPEQSTKILKAFLNPTDKILEAGCGTGLSDEMHFAAGFKDLHGFDLSPEMLAVASGKRIHKSLTCGDMTATLPFRSGEFDAVVCVAVFTHIPDPEPVIREFARVVKGGGAIIFSQRKDLFENREMDELLNQLETERVVTKVHQSEWLPYVTNQNDYVACDIRVGYFVYRAG